MRTRISLSTVRSDFVRQVETISGESLLACNQCGKCSAGCPLAFSMDILPNQVIRYLQLGLDDKVFEANTPWVCASCLQCMSVCPKGVDLARIMEAIRILQLRRGKNEIEIRKFPKEYLESAPQIAFISGYRKFLSLS